MPIVEKQDLFLEQVPLGHSLSLCQPVTNGSGQHERVIEDRTQPALSAQIQQLETSLGLKKRLDTSQFDFERQ